MDLFLFTSRIQIHNLDSRQNKVNLLKKLHWLFCYIIISTKNISDLIG